MPQTPTRRGDTCGATVLARDRFCGHCGADVDHDHLPTESGVRGSQSDDGRTRRTGRWVVAGIAVFVVAAALSGLIVAFIDARRDLDTEETKVAQSQARILELSDQLASAPDPDAALQADLAGTKADLTEAEATSAAAEQQLTEALADLTAERDARAADVLVATQQRAQAVAEVQAQLDAVQAQLTAVQGLFPLEENTVRGAAPAGEYAVTIQPIECTIVACVELRTLSLSFPDSSKVSGNRANGILAFAGGSYSVEGPLAAAQAPLCNGLATTASFQLSFHASTVVIESGLLRATGLVGTYRETISAGECLGQFRSYSLSMVKA